MLYHWLLLSLPMLVVAACNACFQCL